MDNHVHNCMDNAPGDQKQWDKCGQVTENLWINSGKLMENQFILCS